MSQIISTLSEVSDRYKALFVDLWGCVHNGITAYPDAVAALQSYRKAGGVVVLVTNSPKPRAGVAEQLSQFGLCTFQLGLPRPACKFQNTNTQITQIQKCYPIQVQK